jgi:hypothetical protein
MRKTSGAEYFDNHNSKSQHYPIFSYLVNPSCDVSAAIKAGCWLLAGCPLVVGWARCTTSGQPAKSQQPAAANRGVASVRAYAATWVSQPTSMYNQTYLAVHLLEYHSDSWNSHINNLLIINKLFYNQVLASGLAL